MPQNPAIDGGRPYDWGRTSADYARYRDLYPPAFYRRIEELGLCPPGARVLDIGTGTGVLPRHLAGGGAAFVGVDIAPGQIREAERLSAEAGLAITYRVADAETLTDADDSYHAVTACQCFHYFNVDRLAPNLLRMLKPGGLLGIFYLEWLPQENEILAQTEALVLKHSPGWSGAGHRRGMAPPLGWAARHGFRVVHDLREGMAVPFTRESWNGRIRACRGVGATLSDAEVARFEKEHLAMLERLAPESFTLPHEAIFQVLRSQKEA